ncbi:MAG: DoxX family membrane protein, partial [Pseudomonadota bacterium]|nr:DoxX family membrane protein [Pseudomonadota bacterium]
MVLSQLLTAAVRYLLVILFFPFSALDKTLNFKGAVKQAEQLVPPERPAEALVLGGLAIEVFGSVGIVTGVADRLAASVLAGYCGATALLFKQFWKPDDFWEPGESKGRDLFWDFLKNFSLAGGFLLITFGTSSDSVREFLANPTASSQPY